MGLGVVEHKDYLRRQLERLTGGFQIVVTLDPEAEPITFGQALTTLAGIFLSYTLFLGSAQFVDSKYRRMFMPTYLWLTRHGQTAVSHLKYLSGWP